MCANRSVGEFLPYMLGGYCVPTLIMITIHEAGKMDQYRYGREIFSYF